MEELLLAATTTTQPAAEAYSSFSNNMYKKRVDFVRSSPRRCFSLFLDGFFFVGFSLLHLDNNNDNDDNLKLLRCVERRATSDCCLYLTLPTLSL